MKTEFLIYGSSPNALCAALALARAGREVMLLETSRDFGAPYCSQDSGELGLAFTHLCPELMQRFQLDAAFVCHPARAGLAADGRWIRLPPEALLGEARARDRQRWGDFVTLMGQAARLYRGLEQSDAGVLQSWRDLGRRTSTEVLRLPWTSLRDLLDEWFEDDLLKGVLAGPALEGIAQGPFACGTTFHLIPRWALNEVLQPQVAVGGSSKMMALLRRRAEEAGVRVVHECGHPVLDLNANTLSVEGISLSFELLLSDRDVRWTYQQLISPRYLEAEFNVAVQRLRGRGIWTRAVGDLAWPQGWPEELRQDVIHLHPGLFALERCWDEVKRHRFPEKAPTVLRWPAQVDASLPADRVEVSLVYGGDPLSRMEGLPVDQLELMTPADYERNWQCSQGHLWGGETDLSQSLWLRPFPDYEPELTQVDLCGVSRPPADFSGRAGVWAAEHWLSKRGLAASL